MALESHQSLLVGALQLGWNGRIGRGPGSGTVPPGVENRADTTDTAGTAASYACALDNARGLLSSCG